MKETLCSNALFGIVLCAAAWQESPCPTSSVNGTSTA